MGFKMKGSHLYGKTIKQSGRVPSPFKQTKEFKRKDDPYTYRLDKDGKPEYKDLKTGEWKYAKGGQEEIIKAAPKTKKSDNKSEGSSINLKHSLLKPRKQKLSLTKPDYVPFMVDGKRNPDWYLGVNEVHDNWETKYKIKDPKKESADEIVEEAYKSTKGGTDTDYYSETKRKGKITKKEKRAKELEAKLKDISSTDEKEGEATKRGGKLINKKGEKRHAVGKAAQWVRRGILKGRIGAKKKSAERKRKKAEKIDREQELKRAQHEGKVAAARAGKRWAQGEDSGGGDGTYSGKLTDKDRLNSINTAASLLAK